MPVRARCVCVCVCVYVCVYGCATSECETVHVRGDDEESIPAVDSKEHIAPCCHFCREEGERATPGKGTRVSEFARRTQERCVGVVRGREGGWVGGRGEEGREGGRAVGRRHYLLRDVVVRKKEDRGGGRGGQTEK